jgi:hypothetical protein
MSLSFDVAERWPAQKSRVSRDSGPLGQPAVFPNIPVPPYDRELPPEYWQKLRLPKTKENFSCRDARARARGSWWLGAVGLSALALSALALVTAKTLNQAEFPAPLLHSGDLEKNPPRAQLVKPPLTVRRAELVAPRQGTSYWATLPDGRRIVINYMGEVADYQHLPVQAGITNAAYRSRADGNTWIWTVPAGASNVPEWIDP